MSRSLVVDKASAPFSASKSKNKRRRRPKPQCGSDKLYQERCEGWYPSVPWLMERKAELLAIMQVWESNVQTEQLLYEFPCGQPSRKG